MGGGKDVGNAEIGIQYTHKKGNRKMTPHET